MPPYLTPIKFSLFLLVSLCSLSCAAIAYAQDPGFLPTDEIEISKPNTGTTARLKGEIIDFNGEELHFRGGANERVQYFSTKEILQTRYQQSPEHQQAVELLEQKKYAEAERILETAIHVEPREWVRRELLALQIRAALGTFDYEKAGNRFIALCASDEKTRHFNLIPLNWRIPEVDTEPGMAVFVGEVPEATALRWFNDEEPVAQLLGASWLMFREPDDGKLSQKFVQLTRNMNDRIQRAAQMQVWRTHVEAGRYSEIELKRWETRVEATDDLDRGGPYYLLATAYARQLQHDRAAVRWLWLKANHAPDHLLSSDAQLQAGKALIESGRTSQGLFVYRELAAAYPESPAGKAALEQITSP
ncbi:MAG: hypothetical protein CMJ46_06935 [Planctomyces sp.]|nr:hypothetical protein [Planctomyces sp.]